MWDIVYKSFKAPIELFFIPFLFHCYCRLFGHRVDSIVSDGCNQSSFVLFYIVHESLYRCVNTVCAAGKSSSTLLSWYIEYVNIVSVIYCLMHGHYFSCSLVHLFRFFSGPFKKCPEYLKRSTARVFILLIMFLLDSFITSNFLVLLRYSDCFSFFFISLIVLASNIPKYMYVSFSPSVLIFSWFASFIPSVRSRFPLFHHYHGIFSMPNSLPMSCLHILTACVRVPRSF